MIESASCCTINSWMTMKWFLILIFLSLAPVLHAQQPVNPGNLPKGPESGKLKLVAPPDLKVEELSLVSVTRNEATKSVHVQVLIRIKNTGSLRCGISRADAYIKCPADGGRERKLSVSLPVEALNPGASFVKVFTFREAEGSFRAADFSFWIKADAGNQVNESNETNNTSNQITGVVPPR